MIRFWLAIVLGLGAIGLMAQVAPSDLAGCQFNASLPTLSDKQLTVLQCDASGTLLLH